MQSALVSTLRFTNLSWQGECTEFVCAAEYKWERVQVSGRKTWIPTCPWITGQDVQPYHSLCPINPHKKGKAVSLNSQKYSLQEGLETGCACGSNEEMLKDWIPHAASGFGRPWCWTWCCGSHTYPDNTCLDPRYTRALNEPGKSPILPHYHHRNTRLQVPQLGTIKKFYFVQWALTDTATGSSYRSNPLFWLV